MTDESTITDADFEVVAGPHRDYPHFDPIAHTVLMWKLAAEQVQREEDARKNTPLRRPASLRCQHRRAPSEERKGPGNWKLTGNQC